MASVEKTNKRTPGLETIAITATKTCGILYSFCLTFIENRLGDIIQSKTYLIGEFSVIMCFIQKNMI